MALPPRFKGHRLVFLPGGQSPPDLTEPPHTVEMYLDYTCPFSAKMFKTFFSEVAPKIRADGALAQTVQVIFRQQVQPWHPSSTLVHEAALAVLRLAPDRFWDFSSALFDVQKSFFDVSVVGEPRNRTYRRLADLGALSADVDEEEMYKMLAVPEQAAKDGSLNIGNQVTDDLKVLIKMGRLVGVHVSPTVIFNGVVNNEVSSGWSADKWVQWLLENAI